jgi:hypothetical protein
MTEQWDGRPQNPERDGWHWLARAEDGLAILKRWDAEVGAWEDGIMLYPATVMEWGVCYLAPCHTPSEVAAQIEAARREERKACARVADTHGKPVPYARVFTHEEALRAEGYEDAGHDIAAAIRARGDA